MKRPYLVQRLQKPIPGAVRDNPFSFGGGFTNGGLSPKAMDLLRPIFRFDYMGAAEFEFGAVPEAFQKIAKNSKSITSRSFKSRTKEGKSETVYVIAPQEHQDEIEKWIIQKSHDEYGKGLFTKESVGIQGAINKDERDLHCPVGWLELDTGFMFFIDKEMFRKTADLFGVESEV